MSFCKEIWRIKQEQSEAPIGNKEHSLIRRGFPNVPNVVIKMMTVVLIILIECQEGNRGHSVIFSFLVSFHLKEQFVEKSKKEEALPKGMAGSVKLVLRRAASIP